MTRNTAPLLLLALLVKQTLPADTISIALRDLPEALGKERQQTVWLKVADVKGSYSVPHIQSSRDLRVHVDFGGTTCAKAAMSEDRRNFPQFSPTTAHHKPDVNCFQSWMTTLNDRLTASWRQPVFIANEGWGGISTERYLNMIHRNRNWQRRMQQLRPQLWLIHLSVNDERAGVPAETVARNLDAIVDKLISAYAAAPQHIFLAKPSYDYAPGAADILRGYCDQIDELIKRRGLQPGPDLCAAYAKDRERWYGTDPVHPNIDGVDRMAKLWHEAILRALPGGLAK